MDKQINLGLPLRYIRDKSHDLPTHSGYPGYPGRYASELSINDHAVLSVLEFTEEFVFHSIKNSIDSVEHSIFRILYFSNKPWIFPTNLG